MLTVIWVGFLGGVLTGLSPCSLPLLPVLFFAGGSPTQPPATGTVTRTRARPFAVVAGLTLSFTLLVVIGSTVIDFLGLPPDLLRWLGIGSLALVGLGLLVPGFGRWVEAPFRRAGTIRVATERPFLLGLALGVLYVPCAGPVLAAISIAGTAGAVDGRILVLALSFAVGVAGPLLLLATAGSAVTAKVSRSGAGRRVQIAGGLVMIVFAGAAAFGFTDAAARVLPDYTASAQQELDFQLAPAAAVPGNGTLASCVAASAVLADCGAAPAISTGDRWFNSPDNAPLTPTALHGSVVLVDFWTFGCYNCRNALPFVESWYEKYRDSGLVVVGVHTPEFGYEHDGDEIASTIADRGYTFPVVQDNSAIIWSSYQNHYWPALYLIDRDGIVRYVTWGEGNYDLTESHITELLAQSTSA